MYLSEKFIGNSKILIDWVRAMTKLYVSTLGFEEKFTIRGLLRASLNPGDFIHVFLAEPLEDKAKNALEIVKKFVEEYLGFIELRYTVLPVIEYSKAIGKAVKVFKMYNNVDLVILNLSGGMRALILEVLAASLITLNPARTTIEIELESLKGYIRAPLTLLTHIPPTSEEEELLRKISEGNTTLESLAKGLNQPKSTIHRRVRKLIDKGLLSEEHYGRKTYYKLTDLGRIYIYV